MRNDYEVRAQKFIAELFPYIKSCGNLLAFEYAVAWFNTYKHRAVQCKSGATRVVFITSDYVVKMDFGAKDKRRQFGGGADEVEIYNRASRDGMAYLFAKVSCFTYEGINFYIMPKVTGIGRTDWDVEYYLTDAESHYLHYEIGVFDLHCYNYGWKNGYPIIIDYAAHD